MFVDDFFATLFFILVVFAAWTSTISIIEPAVAWLVENHRYSRPRACVVIGVVTWTIGIATVLSFNTWQDYKLFGKTAFEAIDFLTASILLPLGGLSIALFAGWVMSERVVRGELSLSQAWLYRAWYVLIRYVAPLGIGLVFLNLLGIV